ncbi:cell division protein FtsX [Desulfurivibrio dismutans]|uniref:cell division protein FtsX n=1 Tax=Desulfurivibrio dismutans TaxID=1398908 RepID=UPI0023DBC7F5|nr:permease-like cell division protein FtsX [Desulfurivibrio alkaliphilus]MDF1613732.1 permease-like cell division protein FtsX [Desulfurivibrio alkaliphilus]
MKGKPRLTTFLVAILQQTGRNLARSWPTQSMSLLTVALSVLIFAFFLLIHLNMLAAGAKLGDELRLTIYLDEDINPAMQPRIREQIHQFGDIAEVRFISREQAMARFARRLGDEQDILRDLAPDFLPPSIEVVPRPGLLGLNQLSQLADFLSTLPHVSRVQYGQEWLQHFNSFNRLLRIVVLVSAALLTLNMIFTVSRTIQLTLAARREELEILRLLGADRAFVGTPFLAEGLLQGGLGSMLGLGSLYLIFQWTTNQLAGAGILGLFTPVFLPTWLLGLIIGASALLCLFSSLAAINKSLQV